MAPSCEIYSFHGGYDTNVLLRKGAVRTGR
jgi:hypothetical protein